MRLAPTSRKLWLSMLMALKGALESGVSPKPLTCCGEGLVMVISGGVFCANALPMEAMQSSVAARVRVSLKIGE